MKLLLKILFFVLPIFQTNISQGKIILFNQVVSEVKLNCEIVECRNVVTTNLGNDFANTCKSESD